MGRSPPLFRSGARRLRHPLFAIRCSPTEAPRLDRHVPDLAERVPGVLPLFAGAIDGGSCLVVTDGRPRYAELPARELLASLTTGFEEYGLEFVALPEARQIAIQSRKAAHRFLVWDVVDAALVADVAVHAAWPVAFASEAAPDGTVWAASFDTLYNFDPHNWSLRASHRLREEEWGVGQLGSVVTRRSDPRDRVDRREAGRLTEPLADQHSDGQLGSRARLRRDDH